MREELITENIGLAYYMANRFRSTHIEYEELVSLAFLGLVEAANANNPEKDTKFATFAAIVMRNEIMQFAKKRAQAQSSNGFPAGRAC
ncbi:MAG: hypothetical protein KH828_07685 [Clostridiales bacterium]|nr:hypothetical protein [Clostridiales bacterium]